MAQDAQAGGGAALRRTEGLGHSLHAPLLPAPHEPSGWSRRGKRDEPSWSDRPSSSSPLAPRFTKYLMSPTWPRALAGRTRATPVHSEDRRQGCTRRGVPRPRPAWLRFTSGSYFLGRTECAFEASCLILPPASRLRRWLKTEPRRLIRCQLPPLFRTEC